MWSLNGLQNLGTSLLESTEQFAKTQLEPVSTEASGSAEQLEAKNRELTQMLETIKTKARARIQELQAKLTAQQQTQELQAKVTAQQQQQQTQSHVDKSQNDGDKRRVEELTEALREKDGQIALLSEPKPDTQQTLKTLSEKEELIKALGRQIDSLHKTTATLRQKDKDLSKVAAQLQEQKDANSNLESSLSSLRDALAAKDATVNEMKSTIAQYAETIENIQHEKKKELDVLKSDIQSLKSSSSHSQQVSQDLEQSRKAVSEKESEIQELRHELAQFQDRISQFADTSSALAHAQHQLSEVAKRADDLARQLDNARLELKDKDRIVHERDLELDRYKEDNAGIVARYAHEIEDLKDGVKDKSQQVRAVQGELQSASAELERVVSAKDGLDKQFKSQLAEVKQKLGEMAAERDRLLSSTRELESRISELQSAPVEQHQHQQPQLSKEEIARWQLEWREKYKLMEQENSRLRDRTLRAEHILHQQQQQTGSGSTGELYRSGSGYMLGVATIPWLDTKQDDYEDLEALSPSSSFSKRSLKNPSVNIKYFASKYARDLIRRVDRFVVWCGIVLKEQPYYRVGGVLYLALVHLVVLYFLVMYN